MEREVWTLASKAVSTTSPTAQTIKFSEIFVCVSSERHQWNKCYLITCVSIRRHQCLFVMCYVFFYFEITMLCVNKMLIYLCAFIIYMMSYCEYFVMFAWKHMNVQMHYSFKCMKLHGKKYFILKICKHEKWALFII